MKGRRPSAVSSSTVSVDDATTTSVLPNASAVAVAVSQSSASLTSNTWRLPTLPCRRSASLTSPAAAAALLAVAAHGRTR